MKISIITINLNNAQGLEKTLLSEISLSPPPEIKKEIIVIDGGSDDGSTDILRRFENELDHTVSERDNGIYHAMNKGVAAANGDYCIFMNSGDTFASADVLENVFQEANSKSNPDVITGATYYCNPRTGSAELTYPPQKISLGYFYFGNNSLQHQSSFIKTECLKKFPYDESLKIASDFKFWLQCLILNGGRYKSTSIPIANFDMTGISFREDFHEKVQKEIKKIYKDLNLERITSDYELMRNLKLHLFNRFLAKELKEIFAVDINFQ